MPFAIPNVPEDFVSGLALKYTNGHGRHIGFIYKKDACFKVCHLKWHCKLRNESFDKRGYICGSFKLPKVNSKYLAASFSNITDINKCDIPYGIKMPAGIVFDINDRYIGNFVGEGLTCATFILAVLEKNGFNILDKKSWKIRDEDKEWQRNIIEKLRQHSVPEDHITSAEDMIGDAARFRPDEVFAAGVTNDVSAWPIHFHDAVRMAAEIKKNLRKSRSKK